jgi:hypothetical protein
MQQRIGAVALLAQRVELGLPGRQQAGGARTGAQQRDRRDDAEQDDAEAQHQRCGVIAVECGEGREVVGHQRRSGLRVCGIRQQGRHRNDGFESLTRRMRVFAPSPDRVRHFRAPARQPSSRDTARRQLPIV